MYLRAGDRLDARELAFLRAASLAEIAALPPAENHAFAIRATTEFVRLFRAERIVVWVACDDDQIIGSCCAVFYDRLPYPQGSRHAELCGVYVKPDYRRRGLATELVREVIAATRGDARKTFLRPSQHAKALYARLGFVDTELMTLG